MNRVKKSNGLLAVGILFIAANLRAPLTSVSPLLTIISDELEMSLPLTGLVTTIPLVCFAVFSLAAPISAKKIGLETTLFAALIILLIGITLRSSAGTLLLFTGTILIGIAIAHCNVLIPSLIKRDFNEKVGLLTGLYSVTMNVSGAIASGVSLPLLTRFGLTWQWALGIWGIFSLLALLVWTPQLRVQKGLASKTEVVTKTKIVSSKLAWKISVFMGIQSLIFYTILAWLPHMLLAKGLASEFGGALLAILQLCLVPTTFIVSMIAAKLVDQVLLVCLGGGLLLAGVSILAVANSLWQSIVAVSLLGVGIGSCFSLSMMFFSLRTQTAREAAQLSGIAQTVGYTLASLGPFLFGYLFDRSASWQSSYLLLLSLCVLLIYMGLGAGKENYI